MKLLRPVFASLFAVASRACVWQSAKLVDQSPLTFSGRIDGLTVPTRQGDVVGSQVSPGVRRFVGIPYAVSKRWEPPQPPPPRFKAFVASDFGPSCPQVVHPIDRALGELLGRNFHDTQSEDCLSVNVWTPSVERLKGKTAVMVWIHGGSFHYGASNLLGYDGQTLVDNNDDLIVVSFNYRLNIFGQPSSPQLLSQSLSQNFGMLDMDAAVQWIYENIAFFGGDPERIVLFGESAGGIAVDAYTYAYPQDNRVKGVIQQSGNLGFPGMTGATNPTFSTASWDKVSAFVGCGNGTEFLPRRLISYTVITGDDELDCLKAVPYATLTDAIISTNSSFYPVADEITILSDTRARGAKGHFLHVPLLAGSTAHEADGYVVGTQLSQGKLIIPVLTELLSDLLTLIKFTCPTAQVVDDRIKAGVPTWRYLFQGVFKSLSPVPELRAYHTTEIPFVFGNIPGNGTREFALSQYVQGAWVAFARDPINGLAKYGWPVYGASGEESLAELGGFYSPEGVRFTSGEVMDSLCHVPWGTEALKEVCARLFPGGVCRVIASDHLDGSSIDVLV